MLPKQLAVYVLLMTVLINITLADGTVPFLADSSDLVISPIRIVAVLHENGTVGIDVDATANNTGVADIVDLRFRVDSLSIALIAAEVNGTPAVASLLTLTRYTEVLVQLPSPLITNHTVLLHLELSAEDLQSGLVLSYDSLHYQSEFTFYVRPISTFLNFTFLCYLPVHASLSQASVVPLFPAPTGNLTDGHSLAFFWYSSQLQIGQERVFIIKYQVPTSSTLDGSASAVLPMLYAIAGVIAGMLTMRFGPGLVYRVKRIGTTRLVGVTAEEQQILDLIRNKGGSCPQKDLYTDSGMSQAKISVILSNLEERNLVKRFREGRENMVHIMEE
jgi:uncharacterized membrane protein